MVYFFEVRTIYRLHSFSLFAYGIAGTFVFNIMNNLPEQIRNGGFDDVLVKPVKILPYLISSSFICNYIAHMTLSTIVMIVCFKALEIPFTIHVLFRVAGILVWGSLIYAGLFLFVSASAFWATKIDALFNIMYFFREISYYPISIFPKVIQVIVTAVIPYGFINYFPLKELLGKEDAAVFGNIAKWSPLVSIVFFTIACCFFNLSSKCYKSTGS